MSLVRFWAFFEQPLGIMWAFVPATGALCPVFWRFMLHVIYLGALGCYLPCVFGVWGFWLAAVAFFLGIFLIHVSILRRYLSAFAQKYPPDPRLL